MYNKYLIVYIAGLLLLNCTFGDKRPLPTAASTYQSFGANDTTYIRISPDWDAAELGYNFSNPADITIGEDGYIFIADNGNDKIVVLNKAGKIQNHSQLDKISPVDNPFGIDIDSKLNLYIVNGSNKIFLWNQYLNNKGVASVVTHYVVRDTVTNQQFTYTFPELEEAFEDTANNLKLMDYIFTSEQSAIDSVMNISVFYTDAKEDAQFMGVAAGPYGKNFIYATDAGRNRIVKINVFINGVVLLENGWYSYLYRGSYNQVVAGFGSGAGTVDTPGAITTDDNGDIYFTQTGGNFLVQKLSYQDFNSVFNLGENQIMNLTDPPLFVSPADIAVDEDSYIYVVEKEPYTLIKTNPDSSIDTTYCYVHKFTPDGKIMDMGNKGIAVAEFQHPQGIAVDDEDIIYILNSELNRIERFKLSISDEDLPTIE